MISMKSMIAALEVKTVRLVYRDDEAAENQWIHRFYARLGYHFESVRIKTNKICRGFVDAVKAELTDKT